MYQFYYYIIELSPISDFWQTVNDFLGISFSEVNILEASTIDIQSQIWKKERKKER